MEHGYLRPCPFCGSDAELISYPKWKAVTERAHFVRCTCCLIKTAPSLKPEAVQERWNRRAPACNEKRGCNYER